MNSLPPASPAPAAKLNVGAGLAAAFRTSTAGAGREAGKRSPRRRRAVSASSPIARGRRRRRCARRRTAAANRGSLAVRSQCPKFLPLRHRRSEPPARRELANRFHLRWSNRLRGAPSVEQAKERGADLEAKAPLWPLRAREGLRRRVVGNWHRCEHLHALRCCPSVVPAQHWATIGASSATLSASFREPGDGRARGRRPVPLMESHHRHRQPS